MDGRKRNGEDDETASSSDYSISEEEASRRRRRKEKRKRKHEEKRKHRKRKKYSDDEDESDGRRKKRRRSYSSSSDEESDSEDGRKRRSKTEKRKKRKHRRSSDDESESDGERRKKKKLLKEAKKILKDAAKQSDQVAKRSQRETISEDDYYAKSNEFATWLKEYHRRYFSDMSSEETRKFFAKFMDAWNSGGLPDKYYEGIKAGPRTSHKWSFQDNQVDEEEERLLKRKKDKAEVKRFQKEHELVMDELLPKATGKDRLFEKKAIQREKNRNREPSPEPMRESDIMGGGDDFKSMLARDRARREKRTNHKVEALQKKLAVVEEKETAAMDHFRSLVNEAGGKIVIPKRM